MCNRALFDREPETLWNSAAKLFSERPRDNRFDPRELRPKGRAHVVREEAGERAWDVMAWDVLGGQAAWAMTNVRNLALPQWRRLAEKPKNRCLVPLTEFCEWTPDKVDLGDGKPPLKGEMWFRVTDQPAFAIAGFWQRTRDGNGFTMVTCDPNEMVAPIHPKAMITVLHPDDIDTWLRGSYDEIVQLQRPYPADHIAGLSFERASPAQRSLSWEEAAGSSTRGRSAPPEETQPRPAKPGCAGRSGNSPAAGRRMAKELK